jgi:hypothetical protein
VDSVPVGGEALVDLASEFTSTEGLTKHEGVQKHTEQRRAFSSTHPMGVTFGMGFLCRRGPRDEHVEALAGIDTDVDREARANGGF